MTSTQYVWSVIRNDLLRLCLTAQLNVSAEDYDKLLSAGIVLSNASQPSQAVRNALKIIAKYCGADAEALIHQFEGLSYKRDN